MPVKGTPSAKSRLAHDQAAEIAIAMALDTVAAAIAAPGVVDVIVVTDAALTSAFETLGARVVTDAPAGLIPAIDWGIARATPHSGVAVLLGDLPALQPSELGAALAAAAVHPRAIVADQDGTGTALATATNGHALAFGADSRAAHGAAGYVELAGEWPGLRRDVDLSEHLDGLPVGSHTTAALESIGGLTPSSTATHPSH